MTVLQRRTNDRIQLWRLLLCAVLYVLTATMTEAQDTETSNADPSASDTGLSPAQKTWIFNGSVLGAVGVYGSLNWWEEFGNVRFSNEGWFAQDTDNGGADKTGHAFSTYAFSRIFSATYRKFGISEDNAAWQGSLSSFAFMSLLEAGDSFNDFGFSSRDIAANSAGALLAYISERSETFDRFIDFRIEYAPSPGLLKSGETDIFTDYSGMKHLVAFKFSGFEAFEKTSLAFLELHAGYYSRGYKEYDTGHFDQKERNVFCGLSLNLSRLFQQAAEKTSKAGCVFQSASKFLEYYQPPYTSLHYIRKLE